MQNRQQLGVAVLGLGTVGRAVVDLLATNASTVTRRAGCELRPVAGLVRDAVRCRGELPRGMRLTTDIKEVLDDPRVHLVVETMGGLHPAREYVLQALATKRPVALANKELLSTAGRELFAAAEQAGVDLLFEASVCSGLPVLRALRGGLAGDKVIGVAGILNGTTNYVLTRMEAGAPLDRAVAEAQAAGYAEADPGNDLDGRDAAWKLAILSSIAFGRRVAPDLVTARGLDGLTACDIRAGLAMGFRLKQVAAATAVGDGVVEAWVEPAFVPRESPLARVEGVDNAVVLTAVSAGRVLLTGPGAGGSSAAAAIVADLIEAARDLLRGVRDRGCGCEGEAVAAAAGPPSRFWLRLAGEDASRLRLGGVPVERISRRAYPAGPDGSTGPQFAVVTGLVHRAHLRSVVKGWSVPEPIPVFEEGGGPPGR